MLNTKKKPRDIDYIKILLVAWFVESCTLGPNLISQFIIPPVARILFTITSVAICILLVLGKIKPRQLKNKDGTARKKQQPRITIAIIAIGFLVYNIGLITAFLNSSSTTAEDLIGRLLLFATFSVAAVCMTEDIFKKCMDIYCQLLMIFSICAIIVFFAVLVFHVPPINEFTAPVGDRVYQNYIIAFVEAEVDTLKDFKRAGSFYDEPGTFAMFLIPALFWTLLVRPSRVMIFSLLAALLLTFSVGGWAAFGIAFIYVVKIFPELVTSYILKKYKFLTKVFLGLGIIICLNLLLKISDLGWLVDYFSFKFDGDSSPDKLSSVGTRQNEIDLFITTLVENPLGYGIKSKYIPTFSVGFMGSSIEGGILGVFGYFGCFIGMAAHLIENFTSTQLKQSRVSTAILGTNLSMILMSFQRIDMLTFYTGIFMLAFMLNCNIEKIAPDKDDLDPPQAIEIETPKERRKPEARPRRVKIPR